MKRSKEEKNDFFDERKNSENVFKGILRRLKSKQQQQQQKIKNKKQKDSLSKLDQNKRIGDILKLLR